MTLNALYNRASSLATIRGSVAEATTGTVFSVNGTGAVFAQDATGGCTISGAVSIINASHDACSVTISYAHCQGRCAILNGAQLTGRGALDNTVLPERGVVGVSPTARATKVATVETLNRT